MDNGMEWGKLFLPMAIDTMVIIIWISVMAMVVMDGLMDGSTKENLKPTSVMEKEPFIGPMEPNTKEILTMGFERDMALMFLVEAANTMANGKMDGTMALGAACGPMDDATRANGKMA